MTFSPTPEQSAIFDAVAQGDNTLVTALAGTGKTTTIEGACARIKPTDKILCIAFNVRIKEELQKRLGSRATVVTFNGLGHRAIGKALGKNLTLDNDKIFALCKDEGFRGDDLADLMFLVNHARQVGIIPKGLPGKGLLPDDMDLWEEMARDEDIHEGFAIPARRVLEASTKSAMRGVVDFTDQIYISSLMFGAFNKYDVVFVDEAQDLSPQNHIQLRKTAARQIIAVGDPNQAIYAWRGADSTSMTTLRDLRDTWTDLPLTLTFRCPKSVVERQREFVPSFRAADSNLPGSVSSLKEWLPEGSTSSAIISRNNAPLIRAAFRLLRARIPVNLIGRDVGRELKRLYKKINKDDKLSRQQVIDECLIQQQDDPDKADKLQSLIAVLESSKDLDDAIQFLTESRKGAITLSTGHRAKGLEWDTVYHLDPHLIPNQNALLLGGAALQQEDNLRYVIETRTKDRLFLVKGDLLDA